MASEKGKSFAHRKDITTGHHNNTRRLQGTSGQDWQDRCAQKVVQQSNAVQKELTGQLKLSLKINLYGLAINCCSSLFERLTILQHLEGLKDVDCHLMATKHIQFLNDYKVALKTLGKRLQKYSWRSSSLGFKSTTRNEKACWRSLEMICYVIHSFRSSVTRFLESAGCTDLTKQLFTVLSNAVYLLGIAKGLRVLIMVEGCVFWVKDLWPSRPIEVEMRHGHMGLHTDMCAVFLDTVAVV